MTAGSKQNGAVCADRRGEIFINVIRKKNITVIFLCIYLHITRSSETGQSPQVCEERKKSTVMRHDHHGSLVSIQATQYIRRLFPSFHRCCCFPFTLFTKNPSCQHMESVSEGKIENNVNGWLLWFGAVTTSKVLNQNSLSQICRKKRSWNGIGKPKCKSSVSCVDGAPPLGGVYITVGGVCGVSSS